MDANLPAAFRFLRSLGAPVSHYKACSTLDSSPESGSIGRAIDIAARSFDWTWVRMGWSGAPPPAAGVASALLCAGAVLMPAVCALSAWRRPLRHLFALPVGCLVAAGASCLGAL